MTAKEKAKELVNKMSSQTYSYQPYAGAHYNEEEVGWEAGKKCALLAADEVLGWMGADRGTEFWQEVKREIQEL
jgi:hypothetical protein